ncbi:MAG: Nif3-like dinuclear metal center hexameric protein [Marmoricola sp.]
MPSLGEITALLDEWYPPEDAERWDAVGLVCGDPDADVRRILLAVDPVTAVAEEAIELGAQLVVTHHPLLLKGVHGVPATHPKGRIVHRLLRAGCALFTAHTNADSPAGGVSEALAHALGVSDPRPLEPRPRKLDKFVVFAPADSAERIRAALVEAGAGATGAYDSCSFTSVGEGRFRPLDGARPTVGSIGELGTVDEVRIEVVAPRELRGRVYAKLRAAHPHEEPAHDIIELASEEDRSHGSGRIGDLAEPITLKEFAARVARVLPPTAHGVRVAGDPEQRVETVALCGGAGDFLLERARSQGADVYLTSDLRHHPASELRELRGAPALVDVAHWAAESIWLPVLRGRLLDALGDTVEASVSTKNTDPWTFRA